MPDRRLYVIHTPVRHAATGAGFACTGIGIQTELVPCDVEADVERLVEIRILPERLRVPHLRAVQFGDGINHGAKSFKHRELTSIRRSAGTITTSGSGDLFTEHARFAAAPGEQDDCRHGA